MIVLSATIMSEVEKDFRYYIIFLPLPEDIQRIFSTYNF